MFELRFLNILTKCYRLLGSICQFSPLIIGQLKKGSPNFFYIQLISNWTFISIVSNSVHMCNFSKILCNLFTKWRLFKKLLEFNFVYLLPGYSSISTWTHEKNWMKDYVNYLMYSKRVIIFTNAANFAYQVWRETSHANYTSMTLRIFFLFSIYRHAIANVITDPIEILEPSSCHRTVAVALRNGSNVRTFQFTEL